MYTVTGTLEKKRRKKTKKESERDYQTCEASKINRNRRAFPKISELNIFIFMWISQL